LSHNNKKFGEPLIVSQEVPELGWELLFSVIGSGYASQGAGGKP
jgi:hypothetical protein